MRDAEHFKQSYEAKEAPPWDIGRPDFNLIHTVTTTPIQPCKALEIGCGTGDKLAHQGFDVLAVDYSPIAIDKAEDKDANTASKCSFLVLDILQSEVQEASFGFAFDRGFLHLIDLDEVRTSLAKKVSGHLEPGGRWLSLLGNADEKRQGPGPPQRSAKDIVDAVEPYFEVLSLASSHFESSFPQPPRAWVCLMRKRAR